MKKQFITEAHNVEDAIQNIVSHKGMTAEEARNIVLAARLHATKQFGLPSSVAYSKVDPPQQAAGFGSAWRQLASCAASGDKTALKLCNRTLSLLKDKKTLMLSDDNLPDDSKARIDILIQKVEDDLEKLKSEFTELLTSNTVNETIKKVGNKYRLVSHSGKNLGEYPTKAGAEKREKQVNFFKHQNESKYTKVDQLVSEMMHYAKTNKQKQFKESINHLQKYVNNDFPHVSKYIIESVKLGLKEAKRSKYGLPPIVEDASSGASCSGSVASVSSNLFGGTAKQDIVNKRKQLTKKPIKNSLGIPEGVGTGVYEAKDPIAAIEKKIESLEKKYQTHKDQIGLAREKRRMKGDRQLSTREQTLQTRMSEIFSQIAELKKEKKELNKSNVSESYEYTEDDSRARVKDVQEFYKICGKWSPEKIVDLDEKGLFKWKNKKERDFFYSMVDENGRMLPRVEQPINEETDTTEHFTGIQQWKDTIKKCGCAIKKTGYGSYEARDSENNLIGMWSNEDGEGWVDSSQCCLDEELVNEVNYHALKEVACKSHILTGSHLTSSKGWHGLLTQVVR